jgi:hypothetical protein
METGNVVCVDRATGRPRPQQFARPRASSGPGASTQRFARLALSDDGRFVAAASAEGPLACVWEAASGRLLHTIRGHRDPHPITAIGFSSDSTHVLTAAEDGSARLWPLGGAEEFGSVQAAAAWTLTEPGSAEPVALTAAAVAPGRPFTVVAGGIAGQVVLWREGGLPPQELGRMDYAILATAITPDGRWLAATGADKSVWIWDLAARPVPRRVRLEPTPQHTEQAGALLAWPGSRLFASGSDDTTIRFWSLPECSLLGTLSAEQGTTDWVAYTPDGLFDSSIGGERQVAWRDQHGPLELEQVYDQFHVDKLAGQLRRGLRPAAPPHPGKPPPRLAIERPAAFDQAGPEATLTIALGEPGLANVRLYQNGVPVKGDPDFQRRADQQRLRARVRLRRGLNRFYAMAGRADPTAVEGRSEVIEIRSNAADPPGRLHVLALGVSGYKQPGHALQYAGADARSLAGFLQQSGARGRAPGVVIALADDEVTEVRVDEAFARIRDEVRDRPEDTVVVFLAGHADVLNKRFVLLLDGFRFLPPGTGARGAFDPDTVLPYAALYRNLARLGALQRLVVIDACQAEAIADDPGVRKIQELIDVGSQRARTSYLLAARRGEPAGESSVLEHGLLTYALLKGMGDTQLNPVSGPSALGGRDNADRNLDRVVTTDELGAFVALALPALAARLPALLERTGADGAVHPLRREDRPEPAPRLQASDVSFSLIALPSPDVP